VLLAFTHRHPDVGTLRAELAGLRHRVRRRSGRTVVPGEWFGDVDYKDAAGGHLSELLARAQHIRLHQTLVVPRANPYRTAILNNECAVPSQF